MLQSLTINGVQQDVVPFDQILSNIQHRDRINNGRNPHQIPKSAREEATEVYANQIVALCVTRARQMNARSVKRFVRECQGALKELGHTTHAVITLPERALLARA